MRPLPAPAPGWLPQHGMEPGSALAASRWASVLSQRWLPAWPQKVGLSAVTA